MTKCWSCRKKLLQLKCHVIIIRYRTQRSKLTQCALERLQWQGSEVWAGSYELRALVLTQQLQMGINGLSSSKGCCFFCSLLCHNTLYNAICFLELNVWFNIFDLIYKKYQKYLSQIMKRHFTFCAFCLTLFEFGAIFLYDGQQSPNYRNNNVACFFHSMQ